MRRDKCKGKFNCRGHSPSTPSPPHQGEEGRGVLLVAYLRSYWPINRKGYSSTLSYYPVLFYIGSPVVQLALVATTLVASPALPLLGLLFSHQFVLSLMMGLLDRSWFGWADLDITEGLWNFETFPVPPNRHIIDCTDSFEFYLSITKYEWKPEELNLFKIE